MTAKKHTAAQREKLVSEYHTSGQTQNEWCKTNEIGKSTLGKWLKETENKQETEQKWVSVIKNSKEPIKTTNSQQKWAEAEIDPADLSSKTIEIKIGSFTVVVESNFDKLAFAEVMNALQKLC